MVEKEVDDRVKLVIVIVDDEEYLGLGVGVGDGVAPFGEQRATLKLST